jgi:hypothetical protein
MAGPMVLDLAVVGPRTGWPRVAATGLDADTTEHRPHYLIPFVQLRRDKVLVRGLGETNIQGCRW